MLNSVECCRSIKEFVMHHEYVRHLYQTITIVLAILFTEKRAQYYLCITIIGGIHLLVYIIYFSAGLHC